MEGYVSKPIPLAGARNVRDLGGYPVAGGGRTASNVFLRGDSLDRLTSSDAAALQAYGVRLIVDLRSRQEAEMAPDIAVDGAERLHYPLLDEAHSRIAESAGQRDLSSLLPRDMGEVYRHLLENAGNELAQVVRALARCQGVGLFHCSAGKDRTGIIAMLLLRVAGVPDEDILRDYSVTEIYMAERFAAMRKQLQAMGIDPTAAMFSSAPENMEVALRCLDSLGGAEGYLLGHGLEEDTLTQLRSKLIG